METKEQILEVIKKEFGQGEVFSILDVYGRVSHRWSRSTVTDCMDGLHQQGSIDKAKIQGLYRLRTAPKADPTMLEELIHGVS